MISELRGRVKQLARAAEVIVRNVLVKYDPRAIDTIPDQVPKRGRAVEHLSRQLQIHYA